MRVIIAGSRSFTDRDYNAVKDCIERSGFKITEIVSGKARGIDTLGEQYADENNIHVEPFPVTKADWNKYGKRAGYLRNIKMKEYADALIAIWDGISPGTKHMVDIAEKKPMEVKKWLMVPLPNQRPVNRFRGL